MTNEKNEAVVLWLSRHPLTAEQEADLHNILEEYGIVNYHVIMENVTWCATEDWKGDFINNQRKWDELMEKHPSVILGVFPPVALEAVNHDVPLHSAISRQNAKEREDGTKQIEFVHVRWSLNLNR